MTMRTLKDGTIVEQRWCFEEAGIFDEATGEEVAYLVEPWKRDRLVLLPPDGRDNGKPTPEGGRNYEREAEHLANLRLIAAAPELRDAARLVLENAELPAHRSTYADGKQTPAGGFISEEVLAVLRVALRTAELGR
jgi:hypothetical protein